jgi:hypothetical protein
MKHLTTLLAASVLTFGVAAAQPSESQIKARYLKNGVTAVKVVKTVKVWDSRASKYYWKVNLVKTQPVPPAEVDGLSGVTLETHVLATYDIGASTPFWGGVVYSEYKGINLPTPSAADVTAMLQGAAAADPTRFFRSNSGKIGIDRVWTDDPQPEWVNPKSLNVRATMLFKEDVSYTEIAQIEAPILVSLKRATIKGEWTIDGVLQQVEEQKEITRTNKSDAGAGAMSMADRAVEQKNEAGAKRLNVPTPGKFTSIEALVADIHEKLSNLSRDQADYYLIMTMSPELRCTGCVYTPNPNGGRINNETMVAAYDGAGTFRDQFCTTPNKLTIQGGTAWFYNRKGTGESYIMTKKIGDFYYLDAITIRVSKDASENASIRSASCSGGSGSAAPAADNSSSGTTWKVGDQVMVEENGKWYPSVILKVANGEYFIHYDGYSESYDVWVRPERVKKR